MAYTSDIDLGGLGETPKTQDSQIFPDMVDVYNAIHILAQWTGALKERLEESSEQDSSDKPNWENMPFKEFWWGRAAVAITKGQMCGSLNVQARFPGNTSPIRTYNGVVLGCAGIFDRQGFQVAVGSTGGDSDSTIYEWRYMNKFFPRGMTGIAMNNAAIGQWVRLAVGPGIMNIPGFKTGDRLFAYTALRKSTLGSGAVRQIYQNNGSVIKIQAGQPAPYVDGLIQVGVGTGPNECHIYGSAALPVMVNAWGDE